MKILSLHSVQTKNKLSFALLIEFIQNKPTPPYTYGLGKVDTAGGSEHTTRQNRTEVKPDGARETRWGEGAGVALRLREAPCGGEGGGRAEQGFCTSGRGATEHWQTTAPRPGTPCLAVFGASCDEPPPRGRRL